MIKKAIYDVLNADVTITAALAQYRSLPAIFTARIIPENCALPAILITQVSATPWGCRENRGSETMLDVDVYDDKDRSDKALNTLVHNVWRALDRASLSVSGYDTVLCVADSPLQINDPDGFPGYVIRCRVVVLES